MEFITLSAMGFFQDNFLFYMDKCDYKDYSSIKYHGHEFVEIAYVCKGKGRHVINSHEYLVKKGDLFIINTNTPHSFYPSEPTNRDGLTVMNCIFAPQFIGNFNIELPILKEVIQIFLIRSFYEDEISFEADLCFSDDGSQEMENLLDKMYMEYQLKKDGFTEIIKLHLCELLIVIYRNYKKKGLLSNPCEKAKFRFLENAIAYLEENHAKRLNINEISRQAYMSKSYFSYVFREVIGISVIEYLQKIRVEKACKYLLEEPGVPIAEIACRVGYEDYKFFNKVFKKITGMTANMYRKRK